jgi:hypothetical protein
VASSSSSWSNSIDGEVTLAIAGGASLRLRLPANAVPEPLEALPPVDVANLPGATVPLRAGYRSAAATLRVACATAPSRGWAPGVEGLAMARASQIARGAMGGEVTRFEAADVTVAGTRFEQRFEAEVRRGEQTASARGRHLLGFAGEARAAVLCSVVCTELPKGAACGPLVEAVAPEGAWVAAPPPSLWARAILAAAEEPLGGAVIVGAATIAAAALVIARRPRPRAR